MRHMLVAVLLCLPTPALAELTREQCAEVANAIAPISDGVRRAGGAAQTEGFKKVAELSSGPIRDASNRAERARLRLVEVYRELQVASEDLVYQLRLCAR